MKDQFWEKGNTALRVSCEQGLPVRVMRGKKEGSKLMYSYEGLYRVKEHKMVVSEIWGEL